MHIAVREIRRDDCQTLANFLANGLGYKPARFAQIFDVLGRRRGLDDHPKYGLLLEAEGRIVGALITIFSKIEHSGPQYIRCHLTGWYVEPEFRIYGALLAKAATKNPAVCYINTLARPGTYKIIEAQGFRRYSSGKYVVLCPLHLFDLQRRTLISVHGHSSPGYSDVTDVALMDFHARHGCICLWGTLDGRSYPFILRRRKFKGVLPAAQIIFCRETADIGVFAGALSRHLMKRGITMLSFDANGPITTLKGRYFDGLEPRFSKGKSPSLGDLAFTLDAMVPFSRKV